MTRVIKQTAWGAAGWRTRRDRRNVQTRVTTSRAQGDMGTNPLVLLQQAEDRECLFVRLSSEGQSLVAAGVSRGH